MTCDCKPKYDTIVVIAIFAIAILFTTAALFASANDPHPIKCEDLILDDNITCTETDNKTILESGGNLVEFTY